ncbi:MAG: Rv1535 family protein [Mycobacterium sp.]|uniref:Rv1535 family protein n=1 Tax=Mycobacterium sp. TaxID=1785 RepID=UPI0026026D22|nr:Rv1535 family protein [Mycobacterium sp.]MDI3315735.1 Rv1535 family protein [Mycobacterium sp.]
MTAVLWDDVATRVPAAPKLRAVPVAAPATTAAKKTAEKATPAKATPTKKELAKRLDDRPFGVGGDPLVEGAAWLLRAPMHQLYAALWRVGLLEVLA